MYIIIKLITLLGLKSTFAYSIINVKNKTSLLYVTTCFDHNRLHVTTIRFPFYF